jgi:peptide/nickel transport system substrate-binding protein
MDPQMHRQRFTQIISHTMREKLFYQTPPGLALHPLLADSIVQVDDTHYDVKIKQGINFQNGEELTADDVAYTYQRLWDPATESPRASMGSIAGKKTVEVVDSYTVRFTVEQPGGTADAAMRGLSLASQEILQKSTFEKLTKDEARTAPPIGVGPFKFAEWIPEQRVVMDANLDYWQGAPGVEHLIWRTIPEEATRTAELLAGSVDMIYPVTPDFVPQLKGAGMKLEIVPGTIMRMLQMNVREGSPFADPEVRRAMNVAIDKQSIVDNIYQGLAVVQDQVVGVGMEGRDDSYHPFSYDPDAARPILSKITQPLELFVEAQWELPAQAIAEQLRGYGMNVTTVVIDNATMVKKGEDGTFDLALGGAGYGGGNFDSAYYNNQFQCSRLETNRIGTGFCDASLDEKASAMLADNDTESRFQKLQEINRLLTEVYMPWVPLFGEAEVWAMQPYVEGFVGSPAGQMFDLQNVTLEK